MSLTRVTQATKGIEKYLETGQKKGRNYTREELDNRIHLGGDLDNFSRVIELSRKEKNWKSHYWHITHSYGPLEQNIATETRIAIHEEYLKYYFPMKDIDNISYAAEGHNPKIQRQKNHKTGEYFDRLKHDHVAVSKYDIETGNQLRMIPFNYKSDKAFQSYINQKYGLIDPADCMREDKITKKDILDRLEHNEATWQSETKKMRSIISALIDGSDSIDEAKNTLLETDFIKDIKYVQTQKNRYLKVQLEGEDKKVTNINLRGKEFAWLDKFYYNDDELVKKQAIQNFEQNKKNTIEENKAIWQKHQNWWIKEETKRLAKQNKNKNKKEQQQKYDLDAAEKKCKEIEEQEQKKWWLQSEQKIKQAQKKWGQKNFHKNQRVFFIIYKSNIELKLIKNYSIYEKNNTRYLINNDKGIKLFDEGDNIKLKIPNDYLKRQEAVRLALSIAQTKGWSLETMKINGSPEFIAESKRQIAQIKKDVPLDNQEKPKPKNKRNLNNEKSNRLRKPSIAEPGQKPPAKSQHSLRKLSQLPVVRSTERDKMLLQSDESDKLDNERADGVSRLRRIVSRRRGRITKLDKTAAINKKVKTTNYINAVDQAIDDNSNRVKEKLSSNDIKQIKENLAAKSVLLFASKNYKLSLFNYEITDDNKIKNKSNKQKPKNVVDFLTTQCNIKFSEALPICENLYEKQLQKMELEKQMQEKTDVAVKQNQAYPDFENK